MSAYGHASATAMHAMFVGFGAGALAGLIAMMISWGIASALNIFKKIT